MKEKLMVENLTRIPVTKKIITRKNWTKPPEKDLIETLMIQLILLLKIKVVIDKLHIRSITKNQRIKNKRDTKEKMIQEILEDLIIT